MPIADLAVVRLKDQAGRWPAGTEGTVVDQIDDVYALEIHDDHPLLDVTEDQVDVVWTVEDGPIAA